MSKTITLIPAYNKNKPYTGGDAVISALLQLDCKVMVSDEFKENIDNNNVEFCDKFEMYLKSDIAVVLGGDGTLLSASRELASYNLPILGVNDGRMGFLVEMEKDTTELFERLLTEDYRLDERMMLDATVFGEHGEMKNTLTGLNEAVVSKGALARINDFKIFVGGSLLDAFPADGIIVSTPTGSTAYNLSAGGPIISPDMSLMTVTPICPHTLHMRSFVLPDKREVKIEIGVRNFGDMLLTVDGQVGASVLCGDYVVIKKSEYKTKFIRFGNKSFYDVLRNKLSYGRKE